MNKIYKTKYNQALGAWVAVPEIAKGAGKNSIGSVVSAMQNITGLFPAFRLSSIALAIFSVCAINNAYSLPSNLLFICGTGNDDENTRIGPYSAEQQGFYCGQSVLAKGVDSVALGIDSTAFGDTAVVVGKASKAYGTDTIVVGNQSGALAYGYRESSGMIVDTPDPINYDLSKNIILGANSGIGLLARETTDDTVDIDETGKIEKKYNTVIGDSARSFGNRNIVIGKDSQAGRGYAHQNVPKSYSNSIAIGTEANAERDSSVAIGHGAFTGSDAPASIAVGKNARVLRNSRRSIAIGEESEARHFYNVALGAETVTDAQLAVAIGAYSESRGQNAVAIGGNANVVGNESVAIGRANKIGNFIPAHIVKEPGKPERRVGDVWEESRNSTAIGQNNTIKPNVENSVAIGVGNAIYDPASSSVAIGERNVVRATQSIAIGKGNQLYGANSGAFGDPNQIYANSSYAFGNNNIIERSADNTFVLGNSIHAQHSNSVVLGNLSADRAAVAVNNATVGGVEYEGFAGVGSKDNGVVSVGKAQHERQVINVAAGEISKTSTDAINGSQLFLATNAAKTEVKAGNNTTVGKKIDADDKHTVYTVNAEKSTVSLVTDSGLTLVKTEEADKNLTNYALSLSDDTKAKIKKGSDAKDAIDTTGLTFTGDNSTTTGIKKLGTAVAVEGDDNITTEASNTGIKVKLNKSLIGLSSIAITGGPTISNGINMNGGKITGLQDGSAPSDAVNFSQLTSSLAKQKTHYFHVNSSNGANFNNDGATGENAMAIGRAIAANENSIAIGNGANVYKGHPDGNGIAIGTNAVAFQPKRNAIFAPHIHNSTAGIAIGRNTYASESTIDIGAKSMDSSSVANRRAVTSIGADSYAAAHFSTINGSYSTIKTDPAVKVGTLFGFGGLSAQGFASTITGSMNTIKNGSSGNKQDGIANIITGTGNVIEESNGALIIGAGNRISHSLRTENLNSISGLIDPNKLPDAETLNDALDGKELGSVGVLGGGNKIEYANFSNIQGIRNSLTGKSGSLSKFVSIDGYRNQAENVEHLMNFGSFNKVTNGEENIVMGNYNELAGDAEDRSKVKRNVILGFQDENANLIGKNISNNQIIGSNVTVAEGTTKGVLLGDNAKITTDKDDKALTGAVVLGAESVANRAALTTGAVASSNKAKSADNQVYALDTATDVDKQAIVDTVKGELAAVSVGDTSSADSTQWKTRQITGLAAGSDDTDAVNVAQLKAVANKLEDVNTTVNKGWKLNTGKVGTGKVEGNDSIKVGPDAEVKYIAGDNIKLIQNGTEITIQADNVVAYDDDKHDQITLGGVDDNGNKKREPVTLTNVKDGEITKDSKDAVNGSQLYKQGEGVAAIIGGGATYNPTTGTYTGTGGGKGIGDTGATTIHDAIKAVKNSAAEAKTEVKAGKNIVIDPVETGADGQTIYTVKTADVVEFTEATIGGVNISGGKITNLKIGDISDTSTDAVNGSQLHETNERVTTNEGNIANNTATLNKGMDFAGNKGEFNRKLGDKVTIKGSLGDGEKASSTNIRTEADDKGNIEILLADAPTFKGKVTAKGVDASGEKITNVAAGDESATSTDAVNGSQLYKVKQRLNASISKVNEGLNFSGDTGSTHNAQLGSTVRIKGADKNIQTQVSGSTIKIKLADNLELDSVKAGDTVVNNEGVSIHNGPSLTKNGINAGNQRITGVANGRIAPNSRDAVNGGQIYDLANGINNHINQVDDRARGGIASAMASAGLPQAYLPGKSMISASAGTYRGETAIAIGVSSISDNGKWILKGTANANRNDLGVSVGVGYQW